MTNDEERPPLNALRINRNPGDASQLVVHPSRHANPMANRTQRRENSRPAEEGQSYSLY
jgi:hypothetical protein